MTTNFDAKIWQKFNSDGFVHLKNFSKKIESDRLIYRMHELVHKKCHQKTGQVFLTGEDQRNTDEIFLNSARDIEFFFDKHASVEDRLKRPFGSLNKVGHALHHKCPVFRKFSHDERLFNIVKTLGHKKTRLVQSMFIFKQSRFGDEVPPHQDATFLYTEPSSVIGFWFALQDADESNGCLWAIPGGHKSALKHRFEKTLTGFRFTQERRVSWPREKFIPLVAKRGDVILLHGHLPHLSEKNVSHKTRFAYTLHFIDGRNHFPKSNWLDEASN